MFTLFDYVVCYLLLLLFVYYLFVLIYVGIIIMLSYLCFVFLAVFSLLFVCLLNTHIIPVLIYQYYYYCVAYFLLICACLLETKSHQTSARTHICVAFCLCCFDGLLICLSVLYFVLFVVVVVFVIFFK